MNHVNQLLDGRNRQLLTRQFGLADALEEVIDVDLIEQEATLVGLSRTIARHLILDGQIVVHSTVVGTIRPDMEFAVAFHGQKFFVPAHLTSPLRRTCFGTSHLEREALCFVLFW